MTTRPASPEANALRHRPFVFYWLATGAAAFAVQIMSVAVGWQIYDITRNPLHLGYVGLAQFLPPLLLVLVTGLAADRFSRRFIMAACLGVEALCALGLVVFTLSHPTGVTPVFAILVVLGIARAFMNPAADALAPNLVPKAAIAHA
ncbi:MAG: MFS transporter, partial [Aestuariivirga sp.]